MAERRREKNYYLKRTKEISLCESVNIDPNSAKCDQKILEKCNTIPLSQLKK
jgi:hypothetical protein